MNVETYDVTKVADCAVGEQAETARELIAKLGLMGQKRFYGADTPVCPYRKMTAREKWVFELLLPKKTDLTKYEDGPVPLRVLQVCAQATEALENGTLVVWHPENADEKDPVLTYRIGDSWNAQWYLLARWGEELINFEQLMEKAKLLYRVKLQALYAQIKQKVDGAQDRLDQIVELSAAEGKDHLPSFYEL